MNVQTEEQELRELIERERVVAFVDHYVTTLDEPSSFDDEWARSLFTEDVRLKHEIALLEGIEEGAAAHRVVMARWERPSDRPTDGDPRAPQREPTGSADRRQSLKC